MSSLVWAQFPYDNLCDPLEGDAVSGFEGQYVGVRNLNGDLVSSDPGIDCEENSRADGCGIIDVEQDTNAVQCLQNWR